MLNIHIVLLIIGLTSQVNALSIGVIGGGIAGVSTVLELLLNNATYDDVLEITLYEHSDSLLDSTSAKIAATIGFDQAGHFWEDRLTTSDMIDRFTRLTTPNGVKVDDFAFFTLGLLESLRNSDKRTTESFQDEYVEASFNRMKEMIEEYPELMCSSVIGQWCCDSAKGKIVFENQGYSCDNDLGLFHVFDNIDVCKDASNRDLSFCSDNSINEEPSCVSNDKAFFTYDLLNSADTTSTLSSFLQTEANEAKCSIVERKKSGFGKGETFFDLVFSLLQSRGVEFKFGCTVERLDSIDDGDRVRILSKQAACPAQAFDRVVVAAGSYSVKILQDSGVDEYIDWQMIAGKGFILTGNSNDTEIERVAEAQKGAAVQIEAASNILEAAFLRTFDSNGENVIRGAGGLELTPIDELPPYSFTNEDKTKEIFENTASTKQLLNAKNTEFTAGLRPLSYFQNFPLIKKYGNEGKWKHVTLNSGFGFNGWVYAWKAAQITSDLVLQGDVNATTGFAEGFTLELVAETTDVCVKKAKIAPFSPQSILAGFGIGLAAGVFVGLCVRIVIHAKSFCLCCCLRNEKPGRLSTNSDLEGLAPNDANDDNESEYTRTNNVRAKRARRTGFHTCLFIFIVLGCVLAFVVPTNFDRYCNTFSCGADQTCLYGQCFCNSGLCFEDGKCL